jgi:hypothetical protein
MGRPTKFKKRFIQDIKDFFDVPPMRKEVMETITEYNKDGTPRKTAEKWKYLPNKMPTIYGFAKSIGVDYWTVWNWAEKGEDEDLEKKMKNLKHGVASTAVEAAANIRAFSKAYKTAKAAQQEFLMEIGLAGAAPPAAYIFTAKNVTPMRDKVENDVNVRQVKPLLDNLNLDNVYNNNSDEEGSQS